MALLAIKLVGRRKQKHMRPLTLKQRRFIVEYLKHGNATRAVRDSYPGIKTDGGRWNMGSELLRNPKVTKEIERALEAQKVSPEWVLGESIAILKNAKHDRDKLNCLRLISDIGGFTKHEPQIVLNQGSVFGNIEEIQKDIEVLYNRRINPLTKIDDLQETTDFLPLKDTDKQA